MIIAWYSGGGGNRFYQWITKNLRNFDLNCTYDRSNPFQFYPNRYPGIIEGQVNLPVIFTHCMNYNLIQKLWPGHDKVYMIQTDFYKSVKRQWKIVEHKVSENQHPVGGPFSSIKWQTEYYEKYPVCSGNSILVNDQTYPEFHDMIKKEIDSVDCPEFDFALDMFKQHGKDAPILELYNKYF